MNVNTPIDQIEPTTPKQKDAIVREESQFRCIGGSQTEAWNIRLYVQLIETVERTGIDHVDERRRTGALAGLVGIKPVDEIEGMIGAQLIATHNATMDAFRRMSVDQQEPEARAQAVNQATKLTRAFTSLLEALNRHRGKSQQTVTVEHVNVHAGGKAVVGVVERSARGGQSNSEEQAHAKAPYA